MQYTNIIEESVELEAVKLNYEHGDNDVRTDLQFKSGELDIDADVTVYLNHSYDEEVDYSETTIDDVYVHSYTVWKDEEEVDVFVSENEIKTKIIL